MRRVVVTGIGAISPIGLNTVEMWQSVKAGVCGIDLPTKLNPEELGIYAFGEVKDFKPENYMPKKEARRMDRFSQLMMVAVAEAAAQSGIQEAGYDPVKIGVVLGSGMGGLDTIIEENKKIEKSGPRFVSPFFIPKAIINVAAGRISMTYGFKGPCYGVVTACASGTEAIGRALDMIRSGRTDAVMAGGAESTLNSLAVSGFKQMQALSTNKDPKKACRPFDKDRDGFIMGEGAGFLMLEEYEKAKARGANILCELLGYGQTCDAYHITAPDPEGIGAAAAMRMAIDSVSLPKEKVDYINAHGTSTPLNDVTETVAIKRCFGDHAYKLAVSSSKSMTGHLLGAAGAVEAAITVLAIRNGFIPPTIGLENEEEGLDLDFVKTKGRKQRIDYAISNSLGFGGHNSSLLFGSLKEA